MLRINHSIYSHILTANRQMFSNDQSGPAFHIDCGSSICTTTDRQVFHVNPGRHNHCISSQSLDENSVTQCWWSRMQKKNVEGSMAAMRKITRILFLSQDTLTMFPLHTVKSRKSCASTIVLVHWLAMNEPHSRRLNRYKRPKEL